MTARLTATRTFRNALAGLATVGLLGGAIDPDLQALRTADMRLATVAHRLQVAAVGLCPDVARLPGITVQALSQYDAAGRARLMAQLALGDVPSVAAVATGSDAARQGLRPGDAIIAINGAATPAAPKRSGYAQVGATEDQLDAALAQGPVRLRLAPDNREVTLAGDRGCASRVQLTAGGLLRTQADGRYVQISQKMFDLARGDDELAAVTAHELSHNILRHNALKTPSKQAEYEADRLSVWLVARAGYDLGAVLPFWEALRKKTDYGIFADASHPGWGKRIAAITAAVAAVRAQQAAGVLLVPTPK